MNRVGLHSLEVSFFFSSIYAEVIIERQRLHEQCLRSPSSPLLAFHSLSPSAFFSLYVGSFEVVSLSLVCMIAFSHAIRPLCLVTPPYDDSPLFNAPVRPIMFYLVLRMTIPM